MDINTLEIGNRIRNRREELHMTREQLAEKLDITPKFCADIEQGARGMSLKTLINVSRILYMSTDYILFGTESEKVKTPFTLFAEKVPHKQSIYYLRICQDIAEFTHIFPIDTGQDE